MSLNPDWDGRCDWCGGDADDHVSDLGCHCRFCLCCDVRLEAHEERYCADCLYEDDGELDDLDVGPLVEDVQGADRAGIT